MDNLITVVTGYDLVAPVRLKKGDANSATNFSIATDAVVKVSLVDSERLGVLAGPVTLLHTEPGSDWANSLIVVRMPLTSTASITQQGSAILEISVDDGDKLPWFINAKIIKGLV